MKNDTGRVHFPFFIFHYIDLLLSRSQPRLGRRQDLRLLRLEPTPTRFEQRLPRVVQLGVSVAGISQAGAS
jgi:hypothetical protein